MLKQCISRKPVFLYNHILVFTVDCWYRFWCLHAVLLTRFFSDIPYNHTGSSNSTCFCWYSNFYLQLQEKKNDITVLRHGAAVRWVKNLDCVHGFHAERIQPCLYHHLDFTCAKSPTDSIIFIRSEHKPNLYSNSAEWIFFVVSLCLIC